MVKRLKLLSITNCQGPVLLSRFLRPGSAAFRARYEVLDPIEVQNLWLGDRDAVRERIAAADVLLVQPVVRNPVREVTFEAVRAQAAGRPVVSFPALHFDCLLEPLAGGAWGGYAGRPHKTFNDVTLAAAWVAGLTPQVAARAYHAVPTIPTRQLEELVARNIAAFARREEANDLSVRMSDFYRDEWRRQRLHHTKSHPAAAVYEELARRMAAALQLDDLDLGQAPDRRGNDVVSLPLKRWLLKALGCTFRDDPDMARDGGADLPFEELIAQLWAFYDGLGRDALAAPACNTPAFREICDQLAQARAQV